MLGALPQSEHRVPPAPQARLHPNGIAAFSPRLLGGGAEGGVGQTFLSAGAGDFPVARFSETPDWKVRCTGRLESLPYTGSGDPA
jgi:hypothetical protein